MPGNLFCNSDVSSSKGEENSIENQKSWESKPWITSLDLVTLRIQWQFLPRPKWSLNRDALYI